MPDQPPLDQPAVSVLMPTFKQAAFIRRALESLRAQTWRDWELIVIDDGSPDETAALVAPYRTDPRVRYERTERNEGLGAALNRATALALGRYLAYLPSDDLYWPEHLARLVALLDQHPEVFLAYDGLRWAYSQLEPTLRGSEAVGQEAAMLAEPPAPSWQTRLANGNLLALVQVVHRRAEALSGGIGCLPRWTERREEVSDRIEADFWRALLSRGARFAYSGAVGCEWVDHVDQRHKIIAGSPEFGSRGSLSRYRRHYGIGHGEWLNWQPSRGLAVDEWDRYGRFARPVASGLPAPDGLTILIVGSLGFNPERIVAFEERGHKLYELTTPAPGAWDSSGPFPYGDIGHIPLDEHWPERVRALRPDVIYAGVNWEAIPLCRAVLDAGLDVPFVFHFKEGPFICQEQGLWPDLLRLLTESDGWILISEENVEWFTLATDGGLDRSRGFVLDGDLPKADWMTDDWSPKRSAADGAIHTVCAGRPLGLDPFTAIAAAGIHVHFYGQFFHQNSPNWVNAGLATGYMRLHPTVEPAAWTRELSRYDAGWVHLYGSDNGGDLRRASWDDLNLPARIGTYAAAGLPWILRDNQRSRVAVQTLALDHDIGIFCTDFADLAARLRDRPRLADLTARMRAARRAFAFDAHVDDLVAFFRRAIARRQSDVGAVRSCTRPEGAIIATSVANDGRHGDR